MLVSTGITAIPLWVADSCVFGEAGDIMNVRNVPPHPIAFSESWESGVGKKGQGDSCQTPVHTIWMESDTTDSWGYFCHSQG